MPVILQKGQKVDLTKGNPGLSKLIVGLGWDTNKYGGGFAFDLDSAAFMLNDAGKVSSDADFIFYNNPRDPYGALTHHGDNSTGDGDGDDEQIKVDLTKVPPNISKLAFTVTIHDAMGRRQNFGQVSNAYIRIANELTREELMRFDLGEDFSVETAVVIAELYRNGPEWKFNAIASGFQGGLEALCRNFGVNV